MRSISMTAPMIIPKVKYEHHFLVELHSIRTVIMAAMLTVKATTSQKAYTMLTTRTIFDLVAMVIIVIIISTMSTTTISIIRYRKKS